LSPLAAARRSFGVLNIAGDSDVISGKERMRSYIDIEGVANDFGVSAPEYKAAALYFGQTPKPKSLMISRWLRTATSGFNLGGVLTASQQQISLWNVITNGGFDIAVDGAVQSLSALDFSAQTNLNGVASVISSALSGATCVWDGSSFKIVSTTTGAGVKASGTITLTSNPSYGVQASGTITLSSNPTPGDTVTIQGTTVTFVGSSPVGNQVLIGGSASATSANLQAFLEASADVNLALNLYSTLSNVTTVTARVYGTAGNAYTLAKVGAAITLSGATLSGGVNPDTLTVNGTVVTFVPSAPTGNQVLVGPTAAQTSANLQGFLQASSNVNIDDATYSTASLVTTVTYKTAGTAGNAFTLAESSAAITISGATLTGGVVASSVGYATTGSGTDISAQLKLTSATAISLVDGYDAETPVECAAALANKSAAWYGLMFAASVQPTDNQSLDVSALIEALSISRIYGVTITDSGVLSALVTTDLASLQKDAGYKRSFCQYSLNAYAVASMFGRAFSVDFNANRSTITLMYKQEPGVVPEDLSENEASVLKDKRCNVFASYVNDTQIIQYGTMSGDAWFDEIHGLDWMQDAIQTNCYNTLYTSKTKIPQTNAGVNVLVNSISAACDQGVNNGLVAPGVWNADGFGQISTGDYLANGYYIYAQPIELQAQSDRDARIAPPIQVALKLAGAIQELDVLVDVNR
jgi:hypothetical protein